jgi:hypothetical protein
MNKLSYLLGFKFDGSVTLTDCVLVCLHFVGDMAMDNGVSRKRPISAVEDESEQGITSFFLQSLANC